CFFSSRRRHTRSKRDWSSDVCSSDLHISRSGPNGCVGYQSAIGSCSIRSESAASRSVVGRSTIRPQPSRQEYFVETGLEHRQTRSEERRVGKRVDGGSARPPYNNTRR